MKPPGFPQQLIKDSELNLANSILLVVLNSGEKKETKKNKITVKYEIFSNNSDYNILGFLNESMNDL